MNHDGKTHPVLVPVEFRLTFGIGPRIFFANALQALAGGIGDHVLLLDPAE